MNPTPILLLLLSVCGAVAEDGLKAEEETFFKQIDNDGDGKLTSSEFLTGVWSERPVSLGQFQAADENKDGKLADKELDAVESYEGDGQTRSFKQYGEKSGCLKNGEIHVKDYETAVKQQWATFAADEFRSVDKNKDDTLDTAEFMTVYRRLLTGAKERAYVIYNTNKDDGISTEEWFGMVWAGRFDAIAKRASEFFAEADADGDAVLTLEEYMLHGEDSDKERFDQWIPSDEKDRTKIPRETFLKYVDHEFHNTAKETFDLADADKNGKVSKEEFTKTENHGFHLDL